MCEILLVYYLGKKIAEMAGGKGRAPVLYVVLFVLAWFGGEICGAVFGLVLVAGNEEKSVLVYGCALLGAAVGAGLLFLLVAMLPAASGDEDRPRRRRRRRRVEEEDDEDDDDRPRRRRRDDDDDLDTRTRRRLDF